MNHLIAFADHTPALVAAVGERASYRFFEFFTAQIRNPNTRRAYAREGIDHEPYQGAVAQADDARRVDCVA